MEKLSLFGIGPKIGRIMLPLLAVAITASIVWPQYFYFTHPRPTWMWIPGILILVLGLALWISSGKMLIKYVRETRLMTAGPYGLCRNPLYAAVIMFVIPSVSLLMNSWLVLVASVVGYLVFKRYVRQECDEMKRVFGADYDKYCSETPEFFPFPLKKWFGKK
jgi:protein-S-isoprenylcysteine O-methyltransferase Ste14